MEITEQKIIAMLQEALAYAKPDEKDLARIMTLDSRLSDLGIESITALEMAGYLEDKLGVQFPDDELASIQSVRGLADLVRQHMIAV
jgi:acyl carrier protein